MADLFTERARKTLALADREARQLGQPQVDSVHLLMGLLQEGTGVGPQVLALEGLTYKQVRSHLGAAPQPLEEVPGDHSLPLSTEAQAVIESAKRQAEVLGHNYIGTEHILLGLTEVDGVASSMLTELGFSVARIRQEVLVCLGVGEPKMLESFSFSGDSEKIKEFIGPGQVDHLIRQAIQFCWMALPADKRNIQEMETQMRRIFERALKNLKEDDSAFR